MIIFATSANAQHYSGEESSNKEIIVKAFQEWHNGNGNFFDLLTDDVHWEITGSSPYSKVYTSKQEFLDKVIIPLNKKLKVKIKPTVRSIFADSDMVIALWDGEAIALDGRPYKSSYSWYIKMKNGKITEVVAFLDGIEFADIMKRIKTD
ncbi:nuclear transport factor 2 family protein [Flavobacterium sp. MAH-1]|uniref:Nuclear transport factor 2 family protein n=2 Tax=Flavobacterium agri TaxID=2743471 RepID=A0A7Y9C6I7_9FLAO|nr:nuclear transport factor 2 family protein [Flavobacterium agri]NYA71479.1 nuclear transport factor 2 family protein [Flavobacterium agri]